MTMTRSPSASSPPQRLSVSIPQNWSAEQALAVLELLDAIVDLVWDRYAGIIEHIGVPEALAPTPADPFDDELPF
jgi:hypothetical protein